MNRHRIVALVFLAVSVAAVLVYQETSRRRLESSVLTIPIPDGASRVQPKVVSWYYTAFLLAPDGSVWGWGDNSYGGGLLAGNASGQSWPAPRRLGNEADWINLAITHNSVVLLRRDGTLWAWHPTGTNGLPGYPKLFSTNAGWRSIQNGVSHVLALRENGSLWAWGQNNYGQVGDGTTNNHTAPVPIGTNRNWRALAPGAFHNLGVQSNGTLWYWGRIDPNQPITMSPTNTLAPAQYGTETNWVTVASGDYHSVAQKADGSFWFMGPNVPSMTRQPSPSNAIVRFGPIGEVRQLAGGGMHCLALLADGSLVGWGNDYQGALAGRMSDSEPVPISRRRDWVGTWAGGPASFALAENGTLWTWGVKFGEPTRHGFFQQIEQWIEGLRGAFGNPAARGRQRGGTPAYTAIPWPIAKFVTNSAATAAGTNKLRRVKSEN